MLPLRFVAESLGADVQWDGTTRTITITYGG
ncbi:stalk domain-containing protein [Caldisericum sp.]